MRSKVENYAQASETCNITETTSAVADAAVENLTGQEHVLEEPESIKSKNKPAPKDPPVAMSTTRNRSTLSSKHHRQGSPGTKETAAWLGRGCTQAEASDYATENP